MARTGDDMQEDMKMLHNLQIGDRVKYISKSNIVKTGTVTKFTEYNGSYGNWQEGREYLNYTSVTVKLDDNKSHISVSPRNLVLI